MKSLFLAGLLSILLVSHFSYAENVKNNSEKHIVIKHHHAKHERSHSKANDTQPVNINAADVTQLATLKGIGPKKAEAIVAYRSEHGSFKTVDDLAKVKGIGLKSVARLQAKNPGRLIVNS